MNKNSQPSYQRSFLLALGFHCLVLGVIIFNHISKEMKPAVQVLDNKNNKNNKIISAQMITDIKVPKVVEVEPPKETIRLEKTQVKIKREAPEKQETLARLEQEKREKQEKQEKLIQLKKAKQEQEEQAQKKREQAQQEGERLALLKAQSSQEEQQQLLRMIDRYGLLIQAKIHQNWRRPVGMENLYKCKIAVKLGANGEVISARVIDSSGNIEFDRSAELAVLKSSPLPMPPDEKMRTPFNQFTFTFDPETA